MCYSKGGRSWLRRNLGHNENCAVNAGLELVDTLQLCNDLAHLGHMNAPKLLVVGVSML